MIASPVKILGVGFGATVAFMIIAFFMFLLGVFTFNEFISILIGFLISTINVIVGIFFIKKSFSIDYKAFIKVLVGGIMIRLFLTMFLVILVLKFLDISENNFIFSLLFFYFFYLIIEIFYINLRKITVKNGG
jgi:hypothetical protein